ncbi:hypothetical protein FOA52_011946 [Chlamydomonas sp. UWO 241]|nr:hypothetical protein FOA52_011946 [Chlamydomonas sp. UWO 241]
MDREASARAQPQNAPTQVGATQIANADHSGALAGVLAVVQAQAQQIASLVGVVSLLDATDFATGGDGVGTRTDVFCGFSCVAAVAAQRAADGEAGVSLPVRLATNIVRFVHDASGRWHGPAGGGVVSASFLNAKPAVGGIGVEPRGGGVLRVLFTVTSDAVADTVVRWRHELRRCVDSTAVFDVLSDREEAQHQALWPAFLAAKVAGKRAQFHRARLVVDIERPTTSTSLPPPSLPAAPTLDVWVLAGASNMVGDNAGEPSPWPPGAHTVPGKLLMYPWKEGEWVDARPNMNMISYGYNFTDSFGPGLCFGTELLSTGASTRVGLVPVALGGSILANDWVPGKLLYQYLVVFTQNAMAKAPPGARLRGVLFMEGEGSSMLKYNSGASFLAFQWGGDFQIMVNGLRGALRAYNPSLPVVLATQRVADRDRVYPYISQVKQQQERVSTPNLMKAAMENFEMYPVDFTESFGAAVGKQSIHFTKNGTCEMGRAFAQAYIAGRASLTDQEQ